MQNVRKKKLNQTYLSALPEKKITVFGHLFFLLLIYLLESSSEGRLYLTEEENPHYQPPGVFNSIRKPNNIL